MSHIPPVEWDHIAAQAPALTPELEHQAQLRRLRSGLLPKAAVRLHSFFGKANLSHHPSIFQARP